MKKRHLVCAMLAVWLLVRFGPTNRIRVVNESGQTARGVSVEAWGKATELGDIAPGESAVSWFGTHGHEDYLVVCGRLNDGRAIQPHSSVYIVWEDYFSSFEVVIREDGTVYER